MSAIPSLFLLVFFAVFVIIACAIGFTVIKGIGQGTANNAQPVQQDPSEIVAKRTEVSGGENSTSTAYFATFELAGGFRKELQISGHQYGLLAEGDYGQLTHQGTRFLGFVRQPGPAPARPPISPPPPASLVCAYCGNAIAAGAVKCASCGWTWRPALAERDPAPYAAAPPPQA